MRAEFTKETKLILAGRVNYRCCFPGCGNVTIGPGSFSDDEVVVLGEAAHIYAASPKGPRSNKGMKAKDRQLVQNGIWMCRHHARLIDADPYSYSAETLLLWKQQAEAHALKAVKNNDAGVHINTTLVGLPDGLVFEGIWTDVQDSNRWTFTVTRFIYGDAAKLQELCRCEPGLEGSDRYICVESQCEGRLLRGGMDWNFNPGSGLHSITVGVADAVPRIGLNELGADVGINGSGDLNITDGGPGLVQGVELVRQLLEHVCIYEPDDEPVEVKIRKVFPQATEQDITTDHKDFFEQFAAMLHVPGNLLFPVSEIPTYLRDHKEDKILLSRLIKLDLVRLSAIPFYSRMTQTMVPYLNFIKRILSVEVVSTEVLDCRIPVKVKLQWGDEHYWQGEIQMVVS